MQTGVAYVIESYINTFSLNPNITVQDHFLLNENFTCLDARYQFPDNFNLLNH